MDIIEIKKSVEDFEKLRKKLAIMSKKMKFSEDNCPLASDHFHLSQAIFGLGMWKWKCGFCKQKEEE